MSRRLSLTRFSSPSPSPLSSPPPLPSPLRPRTAIGIGIVSSLLSSRLPARRCRICFFPAGSLWRRNLRPFALPRPRAIMRAGKSPRNSFAQHARRRTLCPSQQQQTRRGGRRWDGGRRVPGRREAVGRRGAGRLPAGGSRPSGDGAGDAGVHGGVAGQPADQLAGGRGAGQGGPAGGRPGHQAREPRGAARAPRAEVPAGAGGGHRAGSHLRA